MKIRCLVSITTAACCGFISLSFPQSSHAGTNLVTTTSQGGNASWNAAIWRTNNGSGVGVGTAVSPVAGNTYTVFPNATAFGNNTGNARLRNDITNTGPLITFIGDSLTLSTNTDIRAKNITTPVALSPILNFPGVGGNPGLILDGGILNAGDDGLFVITGKVQVVSQSYICPGDNGGGGAARPNRRFTIAGDLSGSGTMVIFQSQTNNAQTISGRSNTFSGQWIVKAGRLLGTVANSLGTNSITCDPNYVLPVPPFSSTAAVSDIAGPAVLEVNYTLNSAGVLTLVNGGRFRLHHEAVFSAVVIEGTSLDAGIHFFPELIANFPNNFDPGGSGALVVQPFGTPPPIPPTIFAHPLTQTVYNNATARFSVTAADNGFPPLTYQWRRAGTNLSNIGNISGATTNILVVSNASAADAAARYDVVVANASFAVTSSVVLLQLVATNGEPYESAVLSAGPVAFYQLNETGDPVANTIPAWDLFGGYVGTYGNTLQNGNPAYNIVGPQTADGFPGFAAGNNAAQFANASAGAKISVLPWNLNTNTVTITAWINPSGPQLNNVGLVFCRGGTTVAGLNYNSSGYLGYTWNNEQPTYGWNSGLTPPPGQWSLVAVVVSPTNATIYVLNTSGLAASSQAYSHVNQAFEGTTLIGDDSADGGNGARSFNGIIDDVAVFKRALSQSELMTLYSAASGVSSFAPSIAVQPASANLFQGQTAQFTGLAVGTAPLTYQWQAGVTGSGMYTNVADGGQFSGSASPTLTISGIDSQNALDYIVVVTNSTGATISTPPATLTIQGTNAAENITMSIQQPAVNPARDWESGIDWSDGQPASISAAAKPGSTYEVLPGARLRSPQNPVIAAFPGNQLTVDGDGVWVRDPGAGATIGEIRFKQPTYGTVNGVVNFPRLRMNGGQLDAGNDGLLIVGGRIDILTNAPINNDSGNDRGYRIDAQLAGGGSIEYHGYNQTAFMPAYSNNLNIACTSNTFSGSWNVVIGTLLGTATNSLGTNTIIVGTNAALEATYDIRNTNANLVLNGKMFLHRNHVFRSALIRGASLAPGTYTFATLNSGAFSNSFPATWTPQNGAASFSTGSGSLTILSNAGPFITSQPQSLTLYGQQAAQFRVSALGNLPLGYQWQAGAIGSGVFTNLSNAGNVSGATNATLTISNITVASGLDYLVVVSNVFGSVTSSVATLTLQPGPTITLQPVSQDAYQGETVVFRVNTLGLLPQTYTWQRATSGSGGPYTTLTDGGRISGSTTTNLTITALASSDAADYIFIVANAGGSVTSSIATLTVTGTNPPENITWSAVVGAAAGNDWNNGTFWSDGLSASVSSRLKPHSTYEVLPGGRFRPPQAVSFAAFPGEVLTLDGTGVWNETFYTGNGNDATVSELRFKHNNPGTNNYPRLVMAGGILDNGDPGIIYLTGQMDVVSNAIIYATSDSGSERGYTISSWLTGIGGIEYHAWGNDLSGNLNIAGNTNTYSGPWHVFRGVLLGSGLNSLGGGNITTDAGTALETLYNVTNGGDLILNGQMFLHQNDTFRTVKVSGTSLYAGTYTFAQLRSMFPANFPATWPQQVGSSFSSGSGSLTVLLPPAPTVSIQRSGTNVQLVWSGGVLLEANEVTGPWVTNAVATSPFTVTPTAPKKFYRIQYQ